MPAHQALAGEGGIWSSHSQSFSPPNASIERRAWLLATAIAWRRSQGSSTSVARLVLKLMKWLPYSRTEPGGSKAIGTPERRGLSGRSPLAMRCRRRPPATTASTTWLMVTSPARFTSWMSSSGSTRLAWARRLEKASFRLHGGVSCGEVARGAARPASNTCWVR